MTRPAAMRAFTETLTVQVPQDNADLAKRMLVQTAERVRDEVIARQRQRAGVPPSYEQVVNRVRGAALETVRPDGVIVFEWSFLREIASEAVRLLTERGPELSGAWKRSITVFVDDSAAALSAITAKTKLVEISPVIVYARRLERGLDRQGGPFIVQAPIHLVHDTANHLRALYRNVANIKATYVQLQVATGSLRGRARARAQAEMRYPAVEIRALPQ